MRISSSSSRLWAKALATIGTFERLQRGESTEHLVAAGPGGVEMQEAPADEGYLRRFVKAAVEAGILDDEPLGGVDESV